MAVTDSESKSAVDTLLEQLAGTEEDGRVTLPEVLGDYRAIPGRPGWYLRPMKLRQQMRLLEVYQAVGADPDLKQIAQISVELACLLAFRLNVPGSPEQRREAVAAFLHGEPSCLMRPVTPDEVLDTFDSVEDLDSSILMPMGFGRQPEEEADPNA